VTEATELIEMIVETDTEETGTADVLARQTTEAIDEVRAMPMPTLPAETTVIVSARIDTRAARDEVAIVNGTATEGLPVEMPGATTTNDRAGENETRTTIAAVEEAGTDVRIDSPRLRNVEAQARRQRSESQLPT
jgi:hypothetical protein